MNELSRMRYLNALGIENYVSRGQLPGAAPTQRLALVRSASPARPDSNPAIPDLDESRPAHASLSAEISLERPRERERQPAPQQSRRRADTVSFSLAAIFVGQIAWVEQLDANPLANEQVQLIQAMARAVSGEVGRPEVTQFDWPTHRNRQLDLGPEAARAGIVGFLQRQMEQRRCRGLVLLGRDTASRVPLVQMGDINAVVTETTLAMLREPARKRQVWQDLQPLVLRV